MQSGPETLLTNPGLIAKVLVHRAKRTFQQPSAMQAAAVHLLLLLLLSTCSFRSMLLVSICSGSPLCFLARSPGSCAVTCP